MLSAVGGGRHIKMGMREMCQPEGGCGLGAGAGAGLGGGQRQPSQGGAGLLGMCRPLPPGTHFRRREPTLKEGNANPGRRDKGRDLVGRGPGRHPQGSRATSPRLLSKLGVLGRSCCSNVAIGLNKCMPENRG